MRKTEFCLKKFLKPAVLVLQPSNWAQNVPWKNVGLECNNDIALSYIKITKNRFLGKNEQKREKTGFCLNKNSKTCCIVATALKLGPKCSLE